MASLRTKATITALAKPGSLYSRAYVTFLAGDGDYVKGVIGLAKGLKKVRSIYPLVVAVLPDVPVDHRKKLLSHGCIVREIEPVQHALGWTLLARPDFDINYSKLRFWEFVEYHKMIYMDADIQVFDNIDHLFDLPDGNVYGVVDCLCSNTWDNHCTERITWPKELGPEPALYFNAGMFVFEPSLSTYNDIMKTLKLTPPTAFAEQDFLNMFFKDNYKPISPVYNLLIPMLGRHPGYVNPEEVKVVHYCLKVKPWRFYTEKPDMDSDDIRMFVKRWWDIYNDETLESKALSVVVGDVSDEYKAALALSADSVSQYISAAPSAA